MLKLKCNFKVVVEVSEVTQVCIYVEVKLMHPTQFEVLKKTSGSGSYEGSKTGRSCCILVLCLIYCKTACSGMESDSPVGSETGFYAGVRGFDST